MENVEEYLTEEMASDDEDDDFSDILLLPDFIIFGEHVQTVQFLIVQPRVNPHISNNLEYKQKRNIY